MTEGNGHAPNGITLEVSAAELDSLLAGIFEPTTVEVAPGRSVEVRPLTLQHADALYAGGLSGAGLQRFLLARCVYLNGHPLGEVGANRLPVGLAGKLVPLVMEANGMAIDKPGEGEATPADPKA